MTPLSLHPKISSLQMKSPVSCLQPKNKVTMGVLTFWFMLYTFSWRKPLKGANPVPAAIKITFFHFIASVKDDFLSSALMLLGFSRKNLEMRPF